jgi:hypothetical protein
MGVDYSFIKLMEFIWGINIDAPSFVGLIFAFILTRFPLKPSTF